MGAIDYLTEEQLVALYGTFDRDTPTGCRNFAIVRLMAESGLRVGDIIKLRVDDVRRQNGQITHVRLVGRKGGQERMQKVQSWTGAALAGWCNMRTGIYNEKRIRGSVLFCTISQGQATGFGEGGKLHPGNALSRNYIWQFVKRAGEEIGIQGLHPHILRHTAITMFYHQCRDVAKTQLFAQHKNVATTMDIYVHTSPAEVDEVLMSMREPGS